MGATETELVRLQRRKWAWISHAIKGAFLVVSGALITTMQGDGSLLAWTGFTVTLAGTVIQIVDRWFAEGPLVLRKGEQTIIIEPGKDVSKEPS